MKRSEVTSRRCIQSQPMVCVNRVSFLHILSATPDTDKPVRIIVPANIYYYFDIFDLQLQFKPWDFIIAHAFHQLSRFYLCDLYTLLLYCKPCDLTLHTHYSYVIVTRCNYILDNSLYFFIIIFTHNYQYYCVHQSGRTLIIIKLLCVWTK